MRGGVVPVLCFRLPPVSLWGFSGFGFCLGFLFLFLWSCLCFLFFVFLLVVSSRFFCLLLLSLVLWLVGWVLSLLVVGLVATRRLLRCVLTFRLVLCRLLVCRSVSVCCCGLTFLTVCLFRLRLGTGFVLRGLLRLVTLLCVSSVAGVLSRSWFSTVSVRSTVFLL